MNRKTQSTGIIRNKTEIFLLTKQSKKKKLTRFSKQNIMGDKQLSYELYSFRKPLVSNKEKQQDSIKTMTRLPPEWIDHYQNCLFIIKEIQQIKRQMMTYQSKRFTVVKQSQQKQIEIHIYECASNATKKIKKCQKLLQKIKNQAQLQSQADHKTCNSVIYKVANLLRQKTKQIRAQQKAFIEQRKNIQQATKASFLQMAAQKMLQYDDGIQIIEEEDDIDLNSRNQQIMKIVQSIHDLNELYKQLNNMVIIQGSLLDRIDCNVDESYKKVIEGGQHIQKAQQYQQKTSKCSLKIMIILIIAITIFSIILTYKWSK